MSMDASARPDDPRIPADLAPESKLIMAAFVELGLLDLEASTVEEIRALAAAEGPVIGVGPEVGKVEEAAVEGPAGPVPVRLYHPAGPPPERAILWLHGGGWVLGDLDHADADCRRLCVDTGSLVASVDYRLAPEHPYPRPLEDAYAALVWLAARLGGDAGPARLIVGGDSAGGNLAAALSLYAKERGGPRIDRQLLIYPVTDLDFGTASYEAFADGYLLSREAMELFWDAYAGEADAARTPLIAVLRAPDLGGLPPATVVVAGADVLRDEVEAYAARLGDAGVPVDVLRYPGQLHGFWTYGGPTDIGRRVNADIVASFDGPRSP
ncbi:MAG: alpha/beta hydrolase [Actinobacteria bacterium]|nr:alpha/beta hydrolase [Actinomycetota bacterium]